MVCGFSGCAVVTWDDVSAGSRGWCCWRKLFVWHSVTPAAVTSPASTVSSWDQFLLTQVSVHLHLAVRVDSALFINVSLWHHTLQSSCASSLCCYPDEEGVTITLDRFDPGRDQAGASGRVPSTPLPGDVLVPCLFSTQTETVSDAVVQSEAELHHCFKVSLLPAAQRAARPINCSSLTNEQI